MAALQSRHPEVLYILPYHRNIHRPLGNFPIAQLSLLLNETIQYSQISLVEQMGTRARKQSV